VTIVSNGPELIAAINAFNDQGLSGAIVAGPGNYVLPPGQGPVIKSSRMNILGAGEFASTIVFTPTADGQSAIKFDNGGGFSIAQCSFEGFAFTSADTTHQKIMIELVDVVELEIAHIASLDGGWTGNTSEGVRSRGREALRMHDIDALAADLPIHFMQNPRAPGLDTDHYHLYDIITIAQNNPNILVDADVVMTNTTFEEQAWVRGTEGLAWAGTNASASNSLSITNVRWEQEQGGNGYLIDLSGGTLVNSVHVQNVFGGLSARGIRLRGASFATIENLFYAGTSVALDVDGSVGSLALINCYTGAAGSGASASITGQTLIFALQLPSATMPTRTTAFYERSGSTNPTGIIIDGANHRVFTGSLSSGGEFNLASSFSGQERAITMLVAAQNAATGAPAGGMIVATGGAGGGAFCPTPNALFDAGNVPGKLTVLWQGATTMTLLNQLPGGAAVNYTVTMIWT
jgi:hypothetical protein